MPKVIESEEHTKVLAMRWSWFYGMNDVLKVLPSSLNLKMVLSLYGLIGCGGITNPGVVPLKWC